jgi:hypothetical protein
MTDPFLAGQRALIAELMQKYRLPAIYSYLKHVQAGGLIAYMTFYRRDARRGQGQVPRSLEEGEARPPPHSGFKRTQPSQTAPLKRGRPVR